MDRGACYVTVHGVENSRTELNTHTHTHTHTHAQNLDTISNETISRMDLCMLIFLFFTFHFYVLI